MYRDLRQFIDDNNDEDWKRNNYSGVANKLSQEKFLCPRSSYSDREIYRNLRQFIDDDDAYHHDEDKEKMTVL